MFLLKPVVSDSIEKVELTWTVRDTQMQQSEIRKQLAKYELENLPSVLDMLETLHSNEQSAIEDITIQYDYWPPFELIALKRTRTNILHREMVFQGVPGLQFVIQHRRSQHPSVRDSIRAPLRHSQPRLAHSANPCLGTEGHDYPHSSSDEDSMPDIRWNYCLRRRVVRSRGSRSPSPFYDPEYESKMKRLEKLEKKEEEEAQGRSEELRLEKGRKAKEKEEDELMKNLDEKQVVADLLKKYTTFYEYRLED